MDSDRESVMSLKYIQEYISHIERNEQINKEASRRTNEQCNKRTQKQIMKKKNDPNCQKKKMVQMDKQWNKAANE